MWKSGPPTNGAAVPPSANGGVVQRPLSNLQTGGVKTFGLQLPKSKQTTSGLPLSKPKAFHFDDDEEEEEEEDAQGNVGPVDPRKINPLQLESVRAKRYAADAARVLAEDAKAFAYDEVYDEEIASKKSAPLAQAQRLGLGGSTTIDRSGRTAIQAPPAQSKYISALLSKSAQRKIEQESVYERNLLKERAKDDEEHAGKQKFITTAYKEQLAAQAAARAAQEEQDRRDELVEQAKRKGGLLSTSLALAASRGVLEGLASGKGPVVENKDEQRLTSSSSAVGVSASVTGSKHERSTSTTNSPTNNAAAQTSSQRPLHDVDTERSAKRRKTSSDPEVDRGFQFDYPTPVVAAPNAFTGHEESTPTAASNAASSASGTAPSVVHASAVAVVASQLTSNRNPLTKAEEARARLAARKAAVAQ